MSAETRACFDLFAGQSSYTQREIIQKDVESKIKKLVVIKSNEENDPSAIIIEDTRGRRLAYADYYFYDREDRTTLKVMNIQVERTVRKKGLSKLILAKILELNPQITEIVSSLIQDNEKIFYAYLNQGNSVVEAIKQTPAYKVRANLGFSKIKSYRFIERDQHLMDFTVEHE